MDELTIAALVDGDAHALDLDDAVTGVWPVPMRRLWSIILAPDGTQALVLRPDLEEDAA